MDVPRQRMHNTGLAERPFATAEDVVRWHGAIQAQDPHVAKWSVGQRCAGSLVESDVNDALARGTIVRTHVLRPTWHFVAAEDLLWLLALTGPHVQRQNRRWYDELGLDERTRGSCRMLVASALEGGRQLTRKELAAVLQMAGIETSGQRLASILMDCELEAVIRSGGLRGSQHTYALIDEQEQGGAGYDRDDALLELTRRYLSSHGPATVRDLCWWSGLSARDVRSALEGLGTQVVSEAIGDFTLWSTAPIDDRLGPVRGAHLLQTYDELVVGYSESRYFGDPRATAARAAWGDRTLPSGVLLLDGAVAGHWQRRMSGKAIAIQVLTYTALGPAHRQAVEEAAAELSRFLGREATLTVTTM